MNRADINTAGLIFDMSADGPRQILSTEFNCSPALVKQANSWDHYTQGEDGRHNLAAVNSHLLCLVNWR